MQQVSTAPLLLCCLCKCTREEICARERLTRHRTTIGTPPTSFNNHILISFRLSRWRMLDIPTYYRIQRKQVPQVVHVPGHESIDRLDAINLYIVFPQDRLIHWVFSRAWPLRLYVKPLLVDRDRMFDPFGSNDSLAAPYSANRPHCPVRSDGVV